MVAWLDNVLGGFFLNFEFWILKKKTIIKKSGNCLLKCGWETNCKLDNWGEKNGSGITG